MLRRGGRTGLASRRWRRPSRNHALSRNPITSRFAKQDEVIDRPRQLQMDWQNDDITLGDFAGRFAHRKIELDGDGQGSIGLFET